MKKLLLIGFIFMNLIQAQVDLIIFSYDRPMQLYALLESIETYVRGLENINTIYL